MTHSEKVRKCDHFLQLNLKRSAYSLSNPNVSGSPILSVLSWCASLCVCVCVCVCGKVTKVYVLSYLHACVWE